MSRNLDCKVYVGDLGDSASKRDLEEAFGYYGPLTSVWIARNPPGFAFVEFEDDRDAEDAVKGLDGRTVCGRRVRVELSTGRSRGGRGGGGRFGSPPRSRADERCYECGERGHFARDCDRRRNGGGGGGGRRSPYRGRRSYSRSVSRDRSRSRGSDRSRGGARSYSRSRSR